LSLDKLKIDQL